jgi:aryl-alcohol dehydrogenase-like predicted oxidoreductase
LVLLQRIAKKHSVKVSQIATKYILSRQGVGASIIGVRNSRHVESNTQIFAFELDRTDIEEIKKFLDNYPIVDGEPFELERTVDSKYRNIMKMNLNEE